MGKARSGKDTCGDHLVSAHGFKRYAFADRLKEIALEMGWNGEKDEKGRALLQELGTVGRNYDGNMWIRHVTEKIERENPENAVITDCRYKNELDEIMAFAERKGYKAVPVLITRAGAGLSGKLGEHPSEREFENVPAVILHNDGTKEDLYKKTDYLVHVARTRAELLREYERPRQKHIDFDMEPGL